MIYDMFQVPGSTLVEVIPKELEINSLKNVAEPLGHQYFSSAHASRNIKGTLLTTRY